MSTQTQLRRRVRLSALWAAWITLGATALLNMQGAVVRATGSGDGCGESWPTCQGDIIPVSPSFATMLEFSHRLLSVVVLLLGLWLFVQAFKVRREKRGLWYATLVAMAFFILQSLVGAVTVLFGLTGDNVSTARAIILPIHLINSFSMLGALTLAVVYARERTPGRLQIGRRVSVGVLVLLGFLGMYLLTFSGGVAALSNTLFPSGGIIEGLAADLDPSSHPFVRLRGLHPLLGVSVGVYLMLSLGLMWYLQPRPEVRHTARFLAGVYLAQLLLGFVTLLWHNPVLPIVHQAVAMLTFALYAVLSVQALGTLTEPLTARELWGAGYPALAKGNR